MSSEHVQEFTNSNFDLEVLKSAEPVLVDFWAEWCMPCRNLTPIVEQIAREHVGKIKVGKVDIDANREIASNYNIMSIPTIMIFKGGKPVKTLVGFQRKETLIAALAG